MIITEPTIDAGAATEASQRQLSLITPSGQLTVGNYIGALAQMRDAVGECYFGISDLHAMTMPHQPDRLRATILQTQRLMLAAGLDPERYALFKQSDVPEHTGLHYLLECVARVGELSRMIQFKDKGRDRPETRMSLLSYPVLMAADILLYRTDSVPVGDDQTQHVELARDLAQRFNRDYPGQDGPVFVVPRVVHPSVGIRLRNLQDPMIKMSKSDPNPAGVIYLLDPPEVIRRKIKRAVTDSTPGINYDPDHRPGLANLLELGAACGAGTIQDLIDDHDSFGSLKQTIAEAVITTLEPIRTRYAELSADAVREVFARGAERARAAASPTLAAARSAMGV
ncbi:tryptophan--tRNA ligase [Microlunatus sp. Gsoil 973]|uniref:tryptophan--tRNA ligase n=1 Tax=Microlunatus sp. Gsoil 973 TaxID=2672569 RepID=UPI0012B4E605|nr:tryptophan--tRNA ligase [Microlunatus sp. Gsoil 973]QGN33311.1 tryptophan--tRNA ligase [Microlunatus sp. Gsoil 973]